MTVFNNGSVNIRPIGDEQVAFVINGHRLNEAQDVLKEKGSLFVIIPIFSH